MEAPPGNNESEHLLLFKKSLQLRQFHEREKKMTPLILWPSLLLLLLLTYRRLFSKRPKLPPSPPGLPILGNLLQITSPLVHRSLFALSQKHGPLILIRLGQVPIVVASSAEAARDILRTNDSSFLNRPFSRAGHRLTWGSRNISFAAYGEHWRRAKKTSVSHLLNPTRVRSFHNVRADEVALLVRRIAAAAESVVNVSEEVYAYSNGVVSGAAAGRRSEDGSLGIKFKEMLEGASVLMRGLQVDDLFPSLGWIGAISGMDAKVERMARKFDGFLTSILEEHEKRGGAAEEEEEDFVDVMLSLRRGVAAGEFVFDDDDIKAIVMDMIAAGTDTSYVTMEWVMTELIRNPQTMIKLQDEVRGISRGKPMVAEEDLKQMNYLKAVVKETLRLHSPTPLLLPHEAIEDTVVQGYEIPAGTRVIINAWAIARDAKSWESPEDFKPERFLGSPIDYRGQDFQYIPFGAGRRACPGINFAIATVELAVANLAYCFNWALPDGQDARDLNMDEAPGLTTPKKVPLRLVATRWME